MNCISIYNTAEFHSMTAWIPITPHISLPYPLSVHAKKSSSVVGNHERRQRFLLRDDNRARLISCFQFYI